MSSPIATAAIVAGAVALPTLLRMGKANGAANSAAMQALPKTLAGVSLDIAPGTFPTDAWAQMRRALGDRKLETAQLIEVVDAWLAAYRAGAASNKQDFSLVNESLNAGGLVGDAAFTSLDDVCGSKFEDSGALSALGVAMCELNKLRSSLTVSLFSSSGWGLQTSVYDACAKVAAAMEAADTLAQGDRRSDRKPEGILELPGAVAGWVGDKAATVLGSAVGAVVGSPTFLLLVVVGGVAYWKLRK